MESGVLLRDVIASDLPAFFEQQMDPQANLMAAFPARAKEDFMKHWQERILADPKVKVKTILYHGRVAGNILSFEASGNREVGYWLGRQFWGKGIATQALSAFLDNEKTRPLYAHVAKHNTGSFRVLEKCGFKVIGKDKIPFGKDGNLVEEYILKLDND